MTASSRLRHPWSPLGCLVFVPLVLAFSGVGAGCGGDDGPEGDPPGDAGIPADAQAPGDAMTTSDAGISADAGDAGDGSVMVLDPDIEVDPPSLAFGAVEVGTRATRQAFLRNVGTAALTIEVVASAQLDPAFSFEVPPSTVPPGGVAMLEVAFAPTALAEVAGTLEIRTNVPDRPQVLLALSGRGATTGLTVTPDQVDFGNVVIDTSATRAITVTNAQDIGAEVELSLGPSVGLCTAMEPRPPYCLQLRDRAFDPSDRFSLSARESATLEVRFTPRVAGVRSDGAFTLRTCPTPQCETQVRLSGIGVEANLRCRPPQLEFGMVGVGSSATQSVSCENTTNQPLTIISWSITSGRGFEAETARPQVLGPGGTVTIQVTFAPVGMGAFVGGLRIETDAPNQPTVDIPLAGTGG